MLSSTKRSAPPAWAKGLALGLTGLGIFGLLFWASTFSYALFHLFAEGFSITIGVTVFILVLNLRQLNGNSYLTFIGIAYTFVALLDAFHTFAYPGMNIFPAYGTNLTVQLWIAARLLEAVSIVVAMFLFRKKLPFWPVVGGFLLVTAGLVALIFSRNFPEMYVDGTGLTDLKRVLEYLVMALFAVSMVLIGLQKNHFSPTTRTFLYLSFGLTILSEFCFTLYAGPFDIINLLGHFFKILAFYFVYKALIQTGLLEPYEGIFRQLNRENLGLEAQIAERTRELDESLGQFAAILKNLPMCLLVFDFQSNRFRLDAFNTAAVNLFGADELTGKPDFQPNDLPLDAPADWNQQLAAALGNPAHPSFWLLSGSGALENHRFEVRTFPTKPDQLVLLLQDITEKLKTENLLAQTEKLESLGVLAGGIAHDFNNLLAGIFGYVQIAQTQIQSAHPDKALEFLDKAMSVFDRARNLSNQLLTFAKGGAPATTIQDLVPLARQAAEFALAGTGVQAEFEIVGQPAPCAVDENQIGQVFQNLILNARQAMNDQGRLDIRIETVSRGEEAGQAVLVEFRDSGPGIHAKHLSHIFEPFYTTKQTGNGLGLSIVYSVLRKHGGTIEVSSPPGHGAVFRLYFPAALPGKAPSPQMAPVAFSGQGKILVMDDEPDVALVLSRLLGALGFSVEIVPEGRQALEAWQSARKSGQPFRLALLDLTIKGGMGGTETLRELKKIDPEIKALICSGYDELSVRAQATQYGFCGMIPKPYDLEKLKATLADVLDAPANTCQ